MSVDRERSEETLLHFSLRATAAAVCALVLANCSGAHQPLIPSSPNASNLRAANDASAATGATALPGTGATALPGTGATALPGTGATALPGAAYACTLSNAQQPGVAACTVAINVNVPPNSSTNVSPSQLMGFGPADLASAYSFPPGNGATVAVVDAFDDPNAEYELATYRSTYGLPACTTANGCFSKVNQHGDAANYPAADSGWSTEMALDLDMVSAVCPQCHIMLVEANDATLDNLGAGVDTAVRLGARVVSNSYYSQEYAQETSEDVHYQHPGVAITASSGDERYASYPAASVYVTSVSGTTLQRSTGSWSQSAWQYSGHGCSQYVARPQWQQHAGMTNCSTRAAEDLAVVADPQTGVSVFSVTQGGWVVAGGTSVGAPIVAAAYALSGNFASPAFSYEHAAAFSTIGTSPFDPVTGLGTPIGVTGL